MSSPSIDDLDMSLLSSPVPPARDEDDGGGNDDDGRSALDQDRGETSSAIETGDANDRMGDLDMSLLSSPVLPTRGEDGGRSGDFGRGGLDQLGRDQGREASSAIETGDVSMGDLDMSLLNSPVVGRNGDHVRDDLDQDRGKAPFAVETDCVNNSAGMSNLDSFESTIVDARGDDPRPAVATASGEESNDENIANANDEPAEEGPSDERMVAYDGEPARNHKNTTQMVESWREELYMMNVKNSIVLDDLVKLGADV